MRRESSRRINRTWSIIFLITMIVAAAGMSFHVRASTTSRAKNLYKKKINKIGSTAEYYQYKITDIVGSKTPELLIWFNEDGERHGRFQIYTYKNDKIKKILNTEADNLEVYLYRKTKSLMVQDSYHDYQSYSYFKYSSGKYRLKAVKCHNDAAEVRTWYENGNGDKISKSKYNKAVKKLKKGKKTNLNTSSWSYRSNY